MDKRLLDYIQSERGRGISDEAITKTLVDAGWREDAIKSVIALDTMTPKSETHAIPAKNQFNKKLIAAVLGGFFLLAGAVYGYTEFYQSPEQIVIESITNLVKAKSFEYSIDVIDPADPKINFAGGVDMTSLEDIKSYASVSIHSGQNSIAADAIFIDKIVYIKIRADESSAPPFLSSLTDKWIKIDPKSVEDILGSINPDFKRDSKESKVLSEEEAKLYRKKMLSAFEHSNIINVIEFPEKTTGTDLAYRVLFNKDGVKTFVSDINSILLELGDKLDYPINQLNEDQLADFYKMLDEINEDDIPEVFVSVNKKDRFLSGAAVLDEKDEPMVFTFSINSFNTPLQINIPVAQLNLQDLIAVFLPFMFGGFGGSPLPLGPQF